MQKTLLIILLSAFTMSNLHAQFKVVKSTKNTQKLNTVIPPAPPPPPPPPPSSSQTAGPVAKEVPVPVYTLTSVRVNISTGNDNKEFPSKVDISMAAGGGRGYIYYQPGDNMKNEMKINSHTEFGLEKYPTASSQNFALDLLEKEGLNLKIYYNPIFITDAWKIEGVEITLEFKDQNGNLHPTLGSKTIVCNNASGFLNFFYHVMLCSVGGQFVPMTSSIQVN